MGAQGNLSAAAPNNPGTMGGVLNTLMTSTACAASNAWTSAGVIDVTDARYLRIVVSVAGAAVGNIVGVMPLFSWKNERPVAASAATDDWYNVPVSDGTVTNAALPGAYPANTKFENTQTVGVVRNSPLVLQTEPTLASSEDQRISWLLNVADVRWVQFLYQQSDSGTAPSVAIRYAVGS